MFLTIQSIGKIRDATIELKGITVIAGENNTGKSTFGKVLYCMFNTFFDAETIIHNERIYDIRNILRKYIRRYPMRLSNSAIESFFEKGSIRLKLNELMDSYPDFKISGNTLDLLQSEIERSISVDNDEIQKQFITRCFQQEFARKVNHVNRPDSIGKVSLEIKGQKIGIAVKDNQCSNFSDDVGLIHDGIYIDTPFIMDDVNFFDEKATFYYRAGHRDDLLERLTRTSIRNTLVEDVIVKQKVDKLLLNIHQVVEGEFTEDQGILLYIEKGIQSPLPLPNISTGMKTFLVIKRLLELGEIKERGVLIFDEPEIHLHPDWQIKFAEVLVLLQKEFNLTILLTTHSPYFLHAIEVFTEKYGLKENATYYLAEADGDTSGVRNVTDCTDTIYKQLARPFQNLEDIQYAS